MALLFSSCDQPVWGPEKPSHQRTSIKDWENVHALGDFQDKPHQLTTEGILEPLNISNAESLIMDYPEQHLRHFNRVAFTTDLDLLDDIAFIGPEDTTFEIKTLISKNRLLVAKIADPEQVSLQEITYATKLESGKVQVPLKGFAITQLYHVSGSGSNRKLRKVETLEEATHFKADLTRGTAFKTIPKIDVYPVSLFEGEWFYAATLVGSAAKEGRMIGNDVSADFKYENVSRVKFIKTPNFLKAVNLNIDQQINTQDEINFQAALKIPVNWVDYTVAKTGRSKGLAERKVDSQSLFAPKWRERPYVRVNFKRTESAIMDSNNNVLGELEVFKDYISFTLFNQKLKVRIKFSLKKAYPSKPGRVYFESDREKFGFFSSKKDYIQTYKYHRKQDHEKQQVINRFMPEDNKIVFHFTKNSSKKFRDVGKNAIGAWNDAFQQAGTDITVSLDESFDVALGDLRYNAINLIDTVDKASGLGYGPSIVDPQSGEIIAATSNVYVHVQRELLIRSLRQYVLTAIGINGSNQIQELMPLSPVSQIYGGNNIKSSVNQYCPKFHRYIAQLKEEREQTADETLTALDSELETLESCANNLLPTKVLEVLIHELGHNFGLRHNFMGSTDARNFYPLEPGEELITPFSSVMDYPEDDIKPLLKPGKYDVAALKFAYAESIDLTGGGKLQLDTTQSIDENLEGTSAQRHPFLFCTDQQVGLTDPMCQRWDYGTTPLAVVENSIRNFNRFYANQYFRLDKAREPNPENLSRYNVRRVYKPLKNIYNHWRFHLASYLSEDKKYLSNITVEEYQKILDAMSRDPEYQKAYADYRPAALEVFRFYKNFLLLPHRLCYDNPMADIDLCGAESDNSTPTAEPESANAPPAETKQRPDPRIVGYHVNSIIGTEPGSGKPTTEIAGLLLDIKRAAEVAYSRKVYLRLHQSQIFGQKNMQTARGPNFLDEPDLRDEMVGAMLTRILEGQTIQPPKDGISTSWDADSGSLTRMVERFHQDKSRITYLTREMLSGLNVPGDRLESINRLMPFKTTAYIDRRTLYASILNKETAHYSQFSGRYYGASENSTVSATLIRKRQELVRIMALAKLDIQPATARDLVNALTRIAQPAIPDATGWAVMKVRDYLALVAHLQATIQKHPEPKRIHLDGVLQEHFRELDTYQFLMKNQMIAASVLEESASRYFQPLTIRSIQATSAKYETNLPKLLQKIDNYRQHRIEYNAQLDLITEIIE